MLSIIILSLQDLLKIFFFQNPVYRGTELVPGPAIKKIGPTGFVQNRDQYGLAVLVADVLQGGKSGCSHAVYMIYVRARSAYHTVEVRNELFSIYLRIILSLLMLC